MRSDFRRVVAFVCLVFVAAWLAPSVSAAAGYRIVGPLTRPEPAGPGVLRPLRGVRAPEHFRRLCRLHLAQRPGRTRSGATGSRRRGCANSSASATAFPAAGAGSPRSAIRTSNIRRSSAARPSPFSAATRTTCGRALHRPGRRRRPDADRQHEDKNSRGGSAPLQGSALGLEQRRNGRLSRRRAGRARPASSAPRSTARASEP